MTFFWNNAVYLAARYGRRTELCTYAEQLKAHGYRITSRWLSEAQDIPQDVWRTEDGQNPLAHDFQVRFATEDMQDVFQAAIVLAFTEPPRSGFSRGGRMVELGLALAWEKHIWVIGPEENVFCALPEITVVPDFATCLARLTIRCSATP